MSNDLQAYARLKWCQSRLTDEDWAILVAHDSGKDRRVICPADGVRDAYDRYGVPLK